MAWWLVDAARLKVEGRVFKCVNTNEHGEADSSETERIRPETELWSHLHTQLIPLRDSRYFSMYLCCTQGTAVGYLITARLDV